MIFLNNSAHLTDSAKHGESRPRTRDLMSTDILKLKPELDAFDAISMLLAHGVSGALVVDDAGRYRGVFSERSSMSVLLGAVYDQLPTCRVEAFMDSDPLRVIDEERDIFEIMQTFLDTRLRRLAVLRNGSLVGQVSRRDVLRAAVAYVRNTPEAWNPNARQGPGALSDSCCISAYMDEGAKTISEDVDLLSVAEIFRNTPYRRLPVVAQGDLLGLVSRRDLLQAVDRMVSTSSRPARGLLYLSALDRDVSVVQ